MVTAAARMVRGQDPIRRRLRRKVSSANDEEISKPTQCKPAVGQRTRSGYGPFEPPAANRSPGTTVLNLFTFRDQRNNLQFPPDIRVGSAGSVHRSFGR